ncbi:hypothetical protein T4B_9722 [Trichinella pseudospiralis]|uniref:Uncharacterized protein n=1 Tax=Trichinella pseudospiralis TaxID=6337 RepID=A0A0V1GLX6_TRIPS|nr:hypothetical protein T4B_9722 [Trichinella pseudospiralis]
MLLALKCTFNGVYQRKIKKGYELLIDFYICFLYEVTIHR